MRKHILLLLLVLILAMILGACREASPPDGQRVQPSQSEGFKIAYLCEGLTNYAYAADSYDRFFKEKYGNDRIVAGAMPADFEEEVMISCAMILVSDPKVKVFIMNPVIPGTVDNIFETIRKECPEILLVGCSMSEIEEASDTADLAIAIDDLADGINIPKQAQKMGAKAFVHYSVPWHMTNPVLAKQRDLMRETCDDLGIAFIENDLLDPMEGHSAADVCQFMINDVSQKVAKYGRDTNFFSTATSFQGELIKAILDTGAIFAREYEPNQYISYAHVFLADDDDIKWTNEQIHLGIEEKGGTGRFSTWPIPYNLLFPDAAIKYGLAYGEGKAPQKVDKEFFIRCLQESMEDFGYGDYEVHVNMAEGTDNYFLVTEDYITY
ncbi:MAG: DUF3798 domain-containing protein [Clostridiales bacterium]|nr:DUF3798 domain-containing protein [Clostridiales bacterium]